MLGILTHENTDLSIDAIALIAELTEADAMEEAEAGADALLDALLKAQAPELLVQNLSRLDESNEQDARGVHETMRVFESIFEARLGLAEEVCKRVDLLQYLLGRPRVLAVKVLPHSRHACS